MNQPKKEGRLMQMTTATKTPALPEPARDEPDKPMWQAEISRDLAEACERERLKHKDGNKVLTRRAIIEWGLKTWLINVNPAEARKLGIKA